MLRRTFMTAAVGLPWMAAHAQIHDLSDAINQAGRQRMLSQRMGKAWLALAYGVETNSARLVLAKSIVLFESQQVELKAFAPTSDLQATYSQLETVWGDYKATLLEANPDKRMAPTLLQQDAKVLALAQQGTLQYQTVLNKPLGKLVNIAGRQRMLSQRMAKLYFASRLSAQEAKAAVAEINKARSEFVSALELLRNAPEATPRIKDALVLADGQWVFFDAALQKIQSDQVTNRSLAEVYVASENLLNVMDSVTTLYAAIKT